MSVSDVTTAESALTTTSKLWGPLGDALTLGFGPGRTPDVLRAIADWLEAHPDIFVLAVACSLDYEGDGIHDHTWYVTVGGDTDA